jgi:hypothetical protein
MKFNTFENCVKEYSSFDGWKEELGPQREKYGSMFSRSVIIEGAFPEYDMAEKWLTENVGPKSGTTWRDIWFGKTGYDYGFWEFFFKEKDFYSKFLKEVPKFYGIGPKGKWKTEGYNNFIDLP